MKRSKNRAEKVERLFQDTELKETKHYSKKVSAFVLTAFSVLSCVLAVVGFFYIKREFSDAGVIRNWIAQHAFAGSFVMILVCALQVIIALIPGELVEITAGYGFGPRGGALLCLIGNTLGSITAILLVRKFGRRFVESLYPREKIDALPILRNPKKRNLLTAILFLIPGTPKDLMTYVIGLTEMSIPAYILLTTVARFPSIISSTVGGGALGDNKMWFAVVVFLITGVVSLLGYLLYLWIQKRSSSSAHKDE